MKNVYLIGFMGVGKSTIGRLLAERLKMKFYDTDELVEARAGRSIADIFAGEGEARFRELERQIIEEISQRDGQIIALGGGAPLNGDNWQAISSTGVTIYLRAGASTLFNRLKDEGSRPLLAGLEGENRLEEIRRLLREREPYYKRAELIVECRERSATKLVEEIV
ncbi:MAG: shikimate kinase, partial [Candidatus Bipolaricaulia bacterium]